MKIIKELNRDEWAKKVSHQGFANQVHWVWGFGNDGLLYGKGQISGLLSPNDWRLSSSLIIPVLSLEEMKLIVDTFYHLVVFT